MATDRRTKYTKSVIRQALFDLLKEKPLNKITVTDICKMADINRSTFYSYYEDVYALLTQIQNELFENIVLTLAMITGLTISYILSIRIAISVRF